MRRSDGRGRLESTRGASAVAMPHGGSNLLAYNSCVGSTWALSFVGQTIMSVVFFIFILLHLLVARAIHLRATPDRRTDGRRTDGQMDGWTDRRTDGLNRLPMMRFDTRFHHFQIRVPNVSSYGNLG